MYWVSLGFEPYLACLNQTVTVLPCCPSWPIACADSSHWFNSLPAPTGLITSRGINRTSPYWVRTTIWNRSCLKPQDSHLSLSRRGCARFQANAFTASLQSLMLMLTTSSRTPFTQGTWHITLCWHTRVVTAANPTPWRQRHICTAGLSLFSPTQMICHRLVVTQGSWLMKDLRTQ